MNKKLSLAALLDRETARINKPEFVKDDPVQFPRRFSSPADVEIMSILAAVIAWGRRPQILKDCERLIEIMHGEPHHYLLSCEWENLDDSICIHRTCFTPHLKYLLRGLLEIYAKHGSLEQFAVDCHVPEAEAPAWKLVENMQQVMLMQNGGKFCPEVMPSNLRATALKRYNMALRWLVRNDGVVDFGLWSCLRPSQLFIPLDVHVAATSRALGLLERRSNDRKAVELLTVALRLYDPMDPVKYDFALFGLGMEGVDFSSVSEL